MREIVTGEWSHLKKLPLSNRRDAVQHSQQELCVIFPQDLPETDRGEHHNRLSVDSIFDDATPLMVLLAGNVLFASS